MSTSMTVRRAQVPRRRRRPARPPRPKCRPCQGDVGTVEATDLNGLGVAVTASAKAKLHAMKAKLPPPPPKRGRRPKPGRLPPKVNAVMRAPADRLEPITRRKAKQFARDRRRTDGELDRLDRMIEQRKVPAGQMRAAIAKRRQLAAKSLTEDLRTTRAKIANRFARASRKAKGPEAEVLRQASARAMVTPLEIHKGTVIPRCPPGFQRVGSGALDGYPGSGYTGGTVPQYAQLPGAWASPAFAMRQALLAAGGGQILAGRPPAFQVPTFHPLPGAVVQAGTGMGPNIGVRPDQMPPGVRMPGMPALPAQPGMPGVPPATIQNPAYRPDVMPPGHGVSSSAQDITSTDVDDGGLGSDLVLAGVMGAYDEVVGLSDSDVVMGNVDLAGLDDLGELGAIGDKVRAALGSWRNRFKLHRHAMNRKAGAALIASSIAGGGMPLLGAAAGAIIAQTAKGQADEEVATVKKMGGKVTGVKARNHLRRLNRKFRKMGLKVRCVPMDS